MVYTVPQGRGDLEAGHGASNLTQTMSDRQGPLAGKVICRIGSNGEMKVRNVGSRSERFVGQEYPCVSGCRTTWTSLPRGVFDFVADVER